MHLSLMPHRLHPWAAVALCIAHESVGRYNENANSSCFSWIPLVCSGIRKRRDSHRASTSRGSDVLVLSKASF
jgi:hypothetical protein